MEEVTDFEAQFLSAGAIQKILETKEDVSNKTLGGNYPITHPDCTIAKDEYYASLKYLKECFDYFKEEINASGGGGNVDLSDYYTKTEINKMDLADKAWVVAQIGLNADNYYTKAIIDEKIGDIEALLGGL